MQALVNRDAKTANAICNEDDEVDKLYDEAYHDLLMRMIKDPTLSLEGDAPYLGRAQSRANRRPRHQYLRANCLSGDRLYAAGKCVEVLTIAG